MRSSITIVFSVVAVQRPARERSNAHWMRVPAVSSSCICPYFATLTGEERKRRSDHRGHVVNGIGQL